MKFQLVDSDLEENILFSILVYGFLNKNDFPDFEGLSDEWEHTEFIEWKL